MNEEKLKISFERVKEDIENLRSQINELKNSVARPSRPTESTESTNQTTEMNVLKLDIDIFTRREKEILKVFFEHENMALSYVDIAKVLNRSPTTIKNRMNDIRKKNDVFKIFIDEQNRNRFKLKEGLKIEKILFD